MKVGSINTEGTGLTNGHPPIIISGKIADGTVCAINGLLSLDKTTGEFEEYDLDDPSGAACIALETITSQNGAAKVLLHGTFDGDMVVKANGNHLTAIELAAIQANSQIFFV